MKHTLIFSGLLLGLLSGSAAVAQAPSEQPPVEYGEQVSAETINARTLHARAQEWVERHFAYGPKTNFASDAAAGTLSVLGTARLKPVDAKGRDIERAARFEFVFRTTNNGYTYNVGSFRVIADPKEPAVLTNLGDYLAQLRADKNNTRTKNEQRVRAQATSLASEVALSFRSYMNSLPSVEDGSVGLPAAGGNNK